MRHKTILIAGLLGVLAPSCNKSIEPEPAVELSVQQEGELVLASRSAEQSIALSTNQESLAAISQDSWLMASIEGKTLRLKASDNLEPEDRTTTVQIVSGGLVRNLPVRQLSASKTLELGFSPKKLDQWGGVVSIDIVSNVDSWVAKTEADWLKLTPKQRDGILEVSISENTDRKERTALVEITLGNQVKTLQITQSGIIYFLHPFTKFGIKPDELMELEQSRRSKLIEPPRFEYSDGYYHFKTISPIFPEIFYVWNGRLSQIREAIVPIVLPNGTKLTEALKSEILAFYQEQSPDEPLVNLGKVYFSKGLWTDIEFIELADGRDALKFVFVPRQKPLPEHLITKRLPFSPDFVLTKTTQEEVQAWMKTFGGELDNAKSYGSIRHYRSNRKFKKKDNTELVVGAHHRFNFSSVTKTLMSSEHYDALYLSYGYIPEEVKSLEFFLTLEFRKLLADSGFVFVSKVATLSATNLVYHNEARNIKLTINPYTNNRYEEGANSKAIMMKFDRIK